MPLLNCKAALLVLGMLAALSVADDSVVTLVMPVDEAVTETTLLGAMLAVVMSASPLDVAAVTDSILELMPDVEPGLKVV